MLPSLRRFKYQAKSRAVLLAKMYLDRRRHCGAQEFSFRWKKGSATHHVVSVHSRVTGADLDLHLRRGTTDLFTFEQIFCNNDYNLERLARWDDIAARYRALAAQGTPLILDLGANVGVATAQFVIRWPGASVIALEPSPENFETLQRNVAAFPNVRAVQAAVASSDGAVRIANPDDDAWAFRTEAAAAGAAGSIPSLSIPTLLAQAAAADSKSVPFLCKIDIEGFESDLFSGNTDWIDRFPVIVIELHDWMLPKLATSRAFLAAISRHDRDFVYIGENVFSIDNRAAPAAG